MAWNNDSNTNTAAIYLFIFFISIDAASILTLSIFILDIFYLFLLCYCVLLATLLLECWKSPYSGILSYLILLCVILLLGSTKAAERFWRQVVKVQYQLTSKVAPSFYLALSCVASRRFSKTSNVEPHGAYWGLSADSGPSAAFYSCGPWDAARETLCITNPGGADAFLFSLCLFVCLRLCRL